MTDRRVRCAVVGCGGITRHMLRTLQTKPWFEATALVDVNGDALAQVGASAGLPESALFRNLDAALAGAGVDAVLVNTPSEWHYAQTKQAIEAGKHALVAKPVTNCFEQAVELADLADRAGVTLSVGQQIRYNRHYTAVRRFVESGRLGRVEAVWFMNSKPRPKAANLGTMDQPALYENSCHHFDSLLAVLGDPVPETVVCDGFRPSWSPYAGPCMVNALITFSGNLHMSYHGGFSSRAAMYEFRLEGTEGTLCCHGVHMSSDQMRYELASPLGAFEPLEVDEGIPARDPFGPFLDEWYATLCGGSEPPFSGRNNLRTFAMLSASIDSIETGSVVAIARNPRYVSAFTGGAR